MASRRRKPVRKSTRKRPASSGRSAVKRKRNDTTRRKAKTAPRAANKSSSKRRNAGSPKRGKHSTRKGTTRRAPRAGKRAKLKRNRQGGLLEFQGYSFDFENFGDFQRAYRTVGDEREHAYDAFMSAKESATEEDNDDE